MRSKVVDAKSIVDGTLLRKLASEHAETFKSLAPSRPLCPPGRRYWASICSGSEGAHFVMKAANEEYLAQGIDADFVQTFACEIKSDKREWIKGVVGEDVCCFENAEDMGDDTAQCSTHKRKCKVRRNDLLILGTSCKDMSKQSQYSGNRSGPVLAQEKSVGGSAQTFRALKRHVSTHRPLAVLYETVDSMEDS